MIEDVNPYLIEMLGYSYDEFIKERLWEVGAFLDFKANLECLKLCNTKNLSVMIIYRFEQKLGSSFKWNLLAMFMRWAVIK